MIQAVPGLCNDNSLEIARVREVWTRQLEEI